MAKSYRTITGPKALEIWKAVYKNKKYTDHGAAWSWAEITTETRDVYFGSGDDTSLLSFGPNVYITIGL